MLQLLIESIKWLENYESWVLATCGHAYRNESMQGEKSSNLLYVILNEKWHELSEKFAKNLKTFEQESTHDTVESENPHPMRNSTLKMGRKFAGHAGTHIQQMGTVVHHAAGRTCPVNLQKL